MRFEISDIKCVRGSPTSTEIISPRQHTNADPMNGPDLVALKGFLHCIVTTPSVLLLQWNGKDIFQTSTSPISEYIRSKRSVPKLEYYQNRKQCRKLEIMITIYGNAHDVSVTSSGNINFCFWK